MPSPRSRRDLLRALAVGSVGLAGCVGEDESAATTTRTATTTADATTATTTRTTSTTTSTARTRTTSDISSIDERVTATPPGEPSLSPSGEWPAYRFDAQNTGYAPGGDGLRDGEAYWRLRAGGPPSVSDGDLFNVSGYEREGAALTRRDPATMAVRSATDLVEYGVNSPPTVADGRVFVTTFIEAFCLAADRDELLWRGPEMDGIQGTPTVADDTVFVNSGGYKSVPAHLRAFDAATGTERWRYDTGSETKSTPAVADGTVFVNGRDGLHAVDAATGDARYTVPETGARWASPAVSNGTVYVVAEGGELFAIDAADGSVRWRFQDPELDDEPPVLADGLVYAGTESGVVALDTADGSKVTSLGGGGTPVARVGDVLYAVEDGELHALDAGGDGLLWSHRTEQVQISDTIGRTIYGVTPVDGAVYVSARDAFHGIGPADG